MVLEIGIHSIRQKMYRDEFPRSTIGACGGEYRVVWYSEWCDESHKLSLTVSRAA